MEGTSLRYTRSMSNPSGTQVQSLGLSFEGLWDAIDKRRWTEVTKILNSQPRGFEITLVKKDKRNRNILHALILHGYDKTVNSIVKMLLEKIATPAELTNLLSTADKDGNTPLHLAALNKRFNLFEQLLEEQKTDFSNISTLISCENGKPSPLEFLSTSYSEFGNETKSMNLVVNYITDKLTSEDQPSKCIEFVQLLQKCACIAAKCGAVNILQYILNTDSTNRFLKDVQTQLKKNNAIIGVMEDAAAGIETRCITCMEILLRFVNKINFEDRHKLFNNEGFFVTEIACRNEFYEMLAFMFPHMDKNGPRSSKLWTLEVLELIYTHAPGTLKPFFDISIQKQIKDSTKKKNSNEKSSAVNNYVAVSVEPSTPKSPPLEGFMHIDLKPIIGASTNYSDKRDELIKRSEGFVSFNQTSALASMKVKEDQDDLSTEQRQLLTHPVVTLFYEKRMRQFWLIVCVYLLSQVVFLCCFAVSAIYNFHYRMKLNLSKSTGSNVSHLCQSDGVIEICPDFVTVATVASCVMMAFAVIFTLKEVLQNRILKNYIQKPKIIQVGILFTAFLTFGATWLSDENLKNLNALRGVVAFGVLACAFMTSSDAWHVYGRTGYTELILSVCRTCIHVICLQSGILLAFAVAFWILLPVYVDVASSDNNEDDSNNAKSFQLPLGYLKIISIGIGSFEYADMEKDISKETNIVNRISLTFCLFCLIVFVCITFINLLIALFTYDLSKLMKHAKVRQIAKNITRISQYEQFLTSLDKFLGHFGPKCQLLRQCLRRKFLILSFMEVPWSKCNDSIRRNVESIRRNSRNAQGQSALKRKMAKNPKTSHKRENTLKMD